MEKIAPHFKDNIFTCTSVSKTFNLAGMQNSNVIIHNKKVKKKWQDYVINKLHISSMSPFSIVSTVSAYYHGNDWLIEMRKHWDYNLQFIKDYLDEHAPKIKYTIPEGTYLAWIDYRDYDYESKKFIDQLVKDGKVLFENGSTYGEEGTGFLRINTGCPTNVLEESLKRFVSILNRLNKNDKAIDFDFVDKNNEKVSLYDEILDNEKNILMFLRPIDCVLSRFEIDKLVEKWNEIQEKNINVFVVVKNCKDEIDKEYKELPFTIICDEDGAIHEKYNVNETINPADAISLEALETIENAVSLGFDNRKFDCLQLPALFLMDKKGIIEYSKYERTFHISNTVKEVLK